MPLLEPPRRPLPVETARRGLTAFGLFWVRFWAPLWGLGFTLSFHLGAWLAGHTDISAPTSGLTSIIYLTILWPVLLKFPRKAWQTGIMVLSLVLLGTLQGLIHSRTQLTRPERDAPSAWGPSRFTEFTGTTLIRITSWAEPRPEERWQAAGRILGWRPVDAVDPRLEPRAPRRGEGVLLRGAGAPPQPGDHYQALVRFRVPRGEDLPGMFSERRYLAGRNLQWAGAVLPNATLEDTVLTSTTVWWLPLRAALEQTREKLARRLRNLLPGPEGELAGAILLGRRTVVSRGTARLFGQLGLAHLFAVSGLHVGVLLGLVWIPARSLGLSPGGRWALLLILLPPYILLTGLPGSVVRAAGLALLATLGPALGRRVDSLQALGLLYWGNILWQPARVMDTGVLLSYGAVGSILLWGRIRGPALAMGGRIGRHVGELLQMGLAAQWGTLPAVAASFGQISLYSPLANLVAIPLFSLAVWASVLGLLLPSWLGPGLAAWAWLLWRGMWAAVVAFRNVAGTGGLGLPSPGPGAVLSWVGLSLLTAAFLQTRRARQSLPVAALGAALALGLGMIALAYGPRLVDRPRGPRVLQFSVGQGDAALVRFPDGWSAWIDTGGCWRDRQGLRQSPMRRDLLPWLARWGHRSWDAVLLSHGHQDHTGGVPALRSKDPDLHVLGSGRARPDSARVGIWPLPVHRWREWELDILYPVRPLPAHLNENDHSMVVALRQGRKVRYLWTGDLEGRGEAIFLAENQVAAAQVWKAGHHGSHTSGTTAFLERIRPRLVVISCGVGNRYGHPSHGPYVVGADTLAVCRTDRDGSLEFRWNSAGQGRWRSRGGPWHRLP
ncbi:DNA internalization-related competence protein ComEC/Rec2 [bacterium DOLZORAL124_64_63]|nr:MAG: DNA internalization-related competence protein ComEC/Rec2 [bacterium DOLZORAL124_64_63]